MSNFEYLTIKQVADKYPFTSGQIRHFLTMRHRNGLENAIRKIGKRIYVRLDLFQSWIESQGSNGGVS
jgi:hypothetical protein